jgi:hypothetical protein
VDAGIKNRRDIPITLMNPGHHEALAHDMHTHRFLEVAVCEWSTRTTDPHRSSLLDLALCSPVHNRQRLVEYATNTLCPRQLIVLRSNESIQAGKLIW